eukprot:Platyproteum_vivax@DN3573_c0_g1_i1.p1
MQGRGRGAQRLIPAWKENLGPELADSNLPTANLNTKMMPNLNSNMMPAPQFFTSLNPTLPAPHLINNLPPTNLPSANAAPPTFGVYNSKASTPVIMPTVPSSTPCGCDRSHCSDAERRLLDCMMEVFMQYQNQSQHNLEVKKTPYPSAAYPSAAAPIKPETPQTYTHETAVAGSPYPKETGQTGFINQMESALNSTKMHTATIKRKSNPTAQKADVRPPAPGPLPRHIPRIIELDSGNTDADDVSTASTTKKKLTNICIYFSKEGGCKNGSACTFRHIKIDTERLMYV